MPDLKFAGFGITDYKELGKLNGCENDVHHLGTFARDCGFNSRIATNKRADRFGITQRVKWLDNSDFYVMDFSGHGSRIRDRGFKDELDDYMDEVICPYDDDPSTYWDDGIVIDDEWDDNLPSGKGMVIFDCCHSGTSLRNAGKDNPGHNLDIRNRSIMPPLDFVFREGGTQENKLSKIGERHERSIIYIGASQDSQTAADYRDTSCQVCANPPNMSDPSRLHFHGALSVALLSSLMKLSKATWINSKSGNNGRFDIKGELPTYNQLFQEIDKWFGDRNKWFDQIPSFSKTDDIDLNEKIFTP